jgi:hypothetical protein
MLDGAGFRRYVVEVPGAGCYDSKCNMTFICGAKQFKCGRGCLERLDYVH